MSQPIDWFEGSNPDGCRFYHDGKHHIIYIDQKSPDVWGIRRGLCLMGLPMEQMEDGTLQVEPTEQQLAALTDFFGQSV